MHIETAHILHSFDGIEASYIVFVSTLCNSKDIRITWFIEKLFAHSDVDDVHDIMDDIQEQTEIANEISTALSQPVGFQDVDEVIIFM